MGWSEVMPFWKYKSTKHIIMLMLEYCEEIQLFQGCAAVHLEYSSNNCVIVKRKEKTVNSEKIYFVDSEILHFAAEISR